MKPGIKTTEFWIATGVAVLGVLVATGIITPDQTDALPDAITRLGGMVASVAASFGYSLSRGNAKKGGSDA